MGGKRSKGLGGGAAAAVVVEALLGRGCRWTQRGVEEKNCLEGQLKEGGKEGEKEGRVEGRREGWREEGKGGGKEGRVEGRREGWSEGARVRECEEEL